MSKVYTGSGRRFQEVQALPMDEESLQDIERRVMLQPHFLGEPLVTIADARDFPKVVDEASHDLVALDAMGRSVAVSLGIGIADVEADTHALQLAAHIRGLHSEDIGRICRSFIGRPANDVIRRAWEEKNIEISDESVELSSLLASIFERDAEDYVDLINADQRVIIAAEGFTSRLVEVISWLSGSGVNIIGLRYRKYLVNGQEVYFAEQVVPTVDPADDALEVKPSRSGSDSLEPWRVKGRAYHVEKVSPQIASHMNELLLKCKPYVFTVNWSHKHYFWVRGAKRNLRIRTYNRDRLEIGFYNISPPALREFLAQHELDDFEVGMVGGYGDSPFIGISADAQLDQRWDRMLAAWLGGCNQDNSLNENVGGV